MTCVVELVLRGGTPTSGVGRGCPCPVAGHSLRPSRPSLVRSYLRSAIHGSAGQLRRLSGYGHPSRNITWGFDPGRVGSGVGECSRSVGRILARRRDLHRPRAGAVHSDVAVPSPRRRAHRLATTAGHQVQRYQARGVVHSARVRSDVIALAWLAPPNTSSSRPRGRW